MLLALLMMLSISIVGIPTASAKGESAFVDNECIYIDVSQALSGGGHWDDANAELRVFTYYNDSNDANYCHEFEENFVQSLDRLNNHANSAKPLQQLIKACQALEVVDVDQESFLTDANVKGCVESLDEFVSKFKEILGM